MSVNNGWLSSFPLFGVTNHTHYNNNPNSEKKSSCRSKISSCPCTEAAGRLFARGLGWSLELGVMCKVSFSEYRLVWRDPEQINLIYISLVTGNFTY